MAEMILAEITYDGFALNSTYGAYLFNINPAPFTLTAGETYRVKWDGTEYDCIAQEAGNETLALGNGAYLGLEGNGEPFLIGWSEGGVTLFSLSAETSHTVAIYTVDSKDDSGFSGANIVLKDRSGNNITYPGVNKIKVNTAEGGTQNFAAYDPETLIPENIKEGVSIGGVDGSLTVPELIETTIDLDFSDGDMGYAPGRLGKAFSEVIIKQPETLIPENIAEGVDIAGIVGTSSGGVDIKQFAECALTEITSENIGTVAQYAFYGMGQLTQVDTPNLTDIQNNGFQNCTNLKEVKAPKLSSIGNYAFQGCSSLEKIDVRNVNTVGSNAFGGCKALKVLDFGTSINSKIGMNAFSTGGPVGVIIRNTTMIPDASSAAAGYIFGLTTQRLYVPRSMVSTWKASNYMKQYHASIVVAIEDYPDICG